MSPTPTADPFVLRDVDCTFDLDGAGPGAANSYEAHVNRVALVPATSSVTWTPLTPDKAFTGSTGSTWNAEVSGCQDWTTADALSAFLFDNDGKSCTVTFRPRRGSGSTFTAVVTLAAPTVGGDVNTVPVFAVTLPCKAKPTRTPGA